MASLCRLQACMDGRPEIAESRGDPSPDCTSHANCHQFRRSACSLAIAQEQPSLFDPYTMDVVRRFPLPAPDRLGRNDQRCPDANKL